jgi:hypothetical protein
MARFLVSALGAAILLGLVSTLVFAGQPDPGQSGGEDRIGCSPKNICVTGTAQYVYEYTLRDNNGAPVVGFPASQVELRFTACTNPSTRPLNEIPADTDSDNSGIVRWIVNLNFGGADPCEVDVLVQNVEFFSIAGFDTDVCGGLRSPDENGDGLVALADLSIWQQAFVNQTPAWQGDLAETHDCSIALGDLSVWQQHFTCVP